MVRAILSQPDTTSTNTDMTVPRVRAWFEILEFTCDPDAISAAVGVAPSETWRRGSPRRVGGRPHDESGWRLVSNCEASHDLEMHAVALLDRLPTSLNLTRLTSAWVAQLTFVVEVKEEVPSMAFSAETLRRIAGLGADLDIDMYVTAEPGGD